MTEISGGQSTGEKVVMWFCIGFFLVFLAFIPKMAADKDKAMRQAWEDNGCQMYDEYKATDVPAKCSQYFVDAYQPQEVRVQPPDRNSDER